MRCFARVFFFAFAVFSLTGCDLATNYLKPDRSANMEMQDYRDGLAPRLPDVEEGETKQEDFSSIPALQPYVAAATTGMKSMPLVSISVNQSVPLRDVLFELAQQAEYDLELDPRIRGSIIFTARERPFDQVIERISEIAGLRYRFKDDVLRVELDTPYNKTYKIDYLSFVRTNAGSIRNDIAVVSGEETDTGSGFQASSESEANFWGELESNLEQILGGASPGALKTSNDPRITAVEQNPDVQAVAPVDEDGNIQVQPPEAVLRVDSLPVDSMDNGTGAGDQRAQTSFSLNKQAGLVNVYASEKLHAEIKEYLEILRRSSTAQVLIEAKILEVSLNDEYVTGIDWRAIDFPSSEFALNYLSAGGAALIDGLGPGTGPAPTGTSVATASNLVVGYAGNDVQAVIQAISGFGSVRALASPRMTVLNNQSAVLNVATNQVFFEIDIDVSTEDGVTNTDIDSEIRNVPEGILVNVQPSINLDNGTISMALRPTITRIINEVSDPAIQFVTAEAGITGVESLVPELNVQEIDSVIQVRSGQPIVMGGLLQDRAATTEEGVPVLSEMPMFGALFRQHDDLVQKTELVIFLKATILETPSASVHDTDRDLYRNFSSDRRPFKL